MDAGKAALFEAEIAATLDRLIAEAWDSLSPLRRQMTTRELVAKRLVVRAAQGVRDPARLRAYATMQIVPKW